MNFVSRRMVLAGAAALAAPGMASAAAATTLLNASYDPTREFYKSYNTLFAADWKRRHRSGHQDQSIARTVPASRRGR